MYLQLKINQLHLEAVNKSSLSDFDEVELERKVYWSLKGIDSTVHDIEFNKKRDVVKLSSKRVLEVNARNVELT
jgi:hypothetical protein